MTKLLMLGVTILSFTACSDQTENRAQYDLAEVAPATTTLHMIEADNNPAPEETAPIDGKIPVSIPQIAYSYRYGYRLATAEIPKAQQAHVTLCEKHGPQVCRILNMENSGNEGDYATGMLHIEVTAKQARTFGDQLSQSMDDFGGDQIAASISGEVLSKRVVDTEARLRSRILLSQRLTEILRSKKGTVAELVEAERAVTEVNEEIDQARSWLKEMHGRVAFSKIIVNYQSASPGSGGFFSPIREAFGGISSMLGSSIGAAITFIALSLPWILLLSLGIFLRRRFKASDRSFWGRQIISHNEPQSEADWFHPLSFLLI